MSQSVERALIILERLVEGPQRLGPLAETLGTHKSTVLRLLQTLEGRGFVRRLDGEPEFALGLRILELASALVAELDVRTLARPCIEKLAAVTGETVHLATLDRGQVVYLDKVESIHPVRMYSRVGARAPMHCTGVGKAMLGYLDPSRWEPMELRRFTDRTIVTQDDLQAEAARIRERGYARDELEHEETIRCIAAPILDSSDEPVAAISVSVPASRMSEDELLGYVDELRIAASAVTAELGGDPSLLMGSAADAGADA